MKICILPLLSIGLVYGLERPALEESAQERSAPQKIDLSKVKPLPIDRTRQSDSLPAPRELKEGEGIPQLDANRATQNTPWLGVLGEPLPDSLKSHLGIDHGVVLKVVADESPASNAGFRVHDILVKINGKEVLDQGSLREIILDSSPNEELDVYGISEGKEVNYKVKLIGRPSNTPSAPREGLNGNQPEMGKVIPAPQNKARRPRGFSRILKEMGFDNLIDEIAPKSSFNLDFKSSNIIQMGDQEGNVKIQVVNGEKNVTVTDKQGNIQFEGPWNSEEDQLNAPEEVRNRVNNIDFSYKQHKIKFPRREMR